MLNWRPVTHVHQSPPSPPHPMKEREAANTDAVAAGASAAAKARAERHMEERTAALLCSLENGDACMACGA